MLPFGPSAVVLKLNLLPSILPLRRLPGGRPRTGYGYVAGQIRAIGLEVEYHRDGHLSAAVARGSFGFGFPFPVDVGREGAQTGDE